MNTTKGAYPFKDKEEQYQGLTLDELYHARDDAYKATQSTQDIDEPANRWYWDDVNTIGKEIRRRRALKPASVKTDAINADLLAALKEMMREYEPATGEVPDAVILARAALANVG